MAWQNTAFLTKYSVKGIMFVAFLRRFRAAGVNSYIEKRT